MGKPSDIDHIYSQMSDYCFRNGAFGQFINCYFDSANVDRSEFQAELPSNSSYKEKSKIDAGDRWFSDRYSGKWINSRCSLFPLMSARCKYRHLPARVQNVSYARSSERSLIWRAKLRNLRKLRWVPGERLRSPATEHHLITPKQYEI